MFSTALCAGVGRYKHAGRSTGYVKGLGLLETVVHLKCRYNDLKPNTIEQSLCLFFPSSAHSFILGCFAYLCPSCHKIVDRERRVFVHVSHVGPDRVLAIGFMLCSMWSPFTCLCLWNSNITGLLSIRTYCSSCSLFNCWCTLSLLYGC